jgi:hypothetical protein
MIILNGNITYFSLSGLLRLLYSNKLTGVLHVKKKDKSINIHILSGKTLGVEPTNRDSIEQLVEIATWVNGDFSFELTSEENITRNVTVPHDQLTLLIAKKEKEFKELRSSLPPLNAILEMSPAGQSDEIRLLPNEWNLLSKVDGKRTLEEILHITDLDDLSIFAMVVKMLNMGILNVITKDKDLSLSEKAGLEESGEVPEEMSVDTEIQKVEPGQMKELEKIFMRYVGPMGTIILDEILENLKLERTEIPQNSLPELIEKMGLEVDSEDDRHQFDEEALRLFSLDKKNN